MSMRPMAPMVIVAVGPRKRIAEILRGLERKLRQRGLHVQTLRKESNPAVSEIDVVFVPLSDGEDRSLAEEIEQLWSRQWVRWYKEVQHV